MYDDVLTRNEDGELSVRTVPATEQSTVVNPNDVYTRDKDGNLAIRVVGGDSHNKGYFATQSALEEAYPTGEDGDYAIVGSTDTVWVWDSDTGASGAWVDTDTKGQVTSVNNQTGAVTVQETLVNQTNIKSVNGNSLLGSGNLELSTYLPYPNTWTTNSTTKAFCDDIAADTTATEGKAYLGEVTCSDLPASMVNAEIVVEIMDGTTAQDKVIVLTLTSGNTAPYMWKYTYWNGGSNVSGWKTWQEPLVSGTNIKTINGSSLLGSGDITTEAIQVSTLPTASVDELGNVYQFIGTTDANYTHGYFYECVSDGQQPATYSWSQTNVQPTPSGFLSLSGGTMTGEIIMSGNLANITFQGNQYGQMGVIKFPDGFGGYREIKNVTYQDGLAIHCLHTQYSNNTGGIWLSGTTTFVAGGINGKSLSYVYVEKLYNGADINVPTVGGKLALQNNTMPTAGSAYEGQIYQFVGTTDVNYTNGYFYKCVSDGQNPATYSWSQVDVQPTPSGLPDQTGNAGKFLTTDGTSASWGSSIQGPLEIRRTSGNTGNILTVYKRSSGATAIVMNYNLSDEEVILHALNSNSTEYRFNGSEFYPYVGMFAVRHKLGNSSNFWKTVYVTEINNGNTINVPTTAGTMVVAVPPTTPNTSWVLKATVDANGDYTVAWVQEV